MAPLRVALAQINPTVGDIAGNARLINEYTSLARSEEASVVVFPELALTGYPPEDLLLKTHFLDAVGDALEDIAAQTQGIVAVVGFPERADDVYNAAALLADGEVSGGLPQDVPAQLRRLRRAALLPERAAPGGVRARRRDRGGHGVRRHLGAGPSGHHRGPGRRAADREPVGVARSTPGKGKTREHMLAQRARDNLTAVAFCNSVGGQDELVFDGHSLLLDWDGHGGGPGAAVRAVADRGRSSTPPPRRAGGCATPATAPTCAAAAGAPTPASRSSRWSGWPTCPSRSPAPDEVTPGPVAEPAVGQEAEIYAALKLGVRDYVDKNGFRSVVIALSGGIDSALVALVAADALGADRVSCVSMPSPYSSEGTRADARAIAENLGHGVHGAGDRGR